MVGGGVLRVQLRLVSMREHELDDFVKRLEMNGRHIPNYLWIDAVVLVPQLVTERFDFAPRDFRVLSTKLRWKILDGLGNDQQSVLECIA